MNSFLEVLPKIHDIKIYKNNNSTNSMEYMKFTFFTNSVEFKVFQISGKCGNTSSIANSSKSTVES